MGTTNKEAAESLEAVPPIAAAAIPPKQASYRQVETDSKTFPTELQELRALITGSKSDQDKYAAINAAFAKYQAKQPAPIEKDDEKASLRSLQEKLETAIADFKLELRTQNNKAIEAAKQALLHAYEKLEKTWKTEEEKESEDNKRLKKTIKALEISKADHEKYQAINVALIEYEAEREAYEAAIKDQAKSASVAALEGTLAIKAEDLQKAIKLLEAGESRKKNYLWVTAAILFTSAIVIAACFFTLPLAAFVSTALPWIGLATALSLAINYSKHSYNSKITAGRGFAVFIALATAVVAFVSIETAFPLAGALVFASGCFLANLILFRASVPDVLNDAAKYIKNIREKTTPAKVLIAVAGLVTGFVLTIGMWHSWLTVFPLAGSLGILAAPYIFYPLMIVVFIANAAFVSRGLSRVMNFLLQSISIYKNGLILLTNKDGTDCYAECKPEDHIPEDKKAFRGFKALLIHYFEIKPNDRSGKVFAKVLFHCVIKLGVVALVAFISQIALVNMNLSSITEVLPALQGAAMEAIKWVACIAACSSRVSFIMFDLLVNVARFTQFICDKKSVYAFFTGIGSFFTLKRWGQLVGSYQRLVEEQTQSQSVVDVWRATAGDDWKTLWENQIKIDWNKTRFLGAVYCHLSALGIIAMRLLTIPAIVLNTVSNAYIATYHASSSAEGLSSPVAKAATGGVSSAGLVFFSANNVQEKQDTRFKPQVSKMKMEYQLIVADAPAELSCSSKTQTPTNQPIASNLRVAELGSPQAAAASAISQETRRRLAGVVVANGRPTPLKPDLRSTPRSRDWMRLMATPARSGRHPSAARAAAHSSFTSEAAAAPAPSAS